MKEDSEIDPQKIVTFLEKEYSFSVTSVTKGGVTDQRV